MKKILTAVTVGFVVFCGWLVVESGLLEVSKNASASKQQRCILLQQKPANEKAETPNEPSSRAEALVAADFTDFTATGGPTATVILGAKDPETEDPDAGFKLQVELSSIGSAVKKATFSNGNNKGFDDRDHEDPKPLQILSPVRLAGGREILSLANKELVLLRQDRQFPLDQLSWESFGIETAENGTQTARFRIVIKDPAGQPILRLNKTYRLSVGSYLLECNVTAENLSGDEQEVRFNLGGPVGMGREAARSDMRKVVGGFATSEGNVVSAQQGIMVSFFAKFRGGAGLRDATQQYEQALRSGSEEQIRDAKTNLRIGYNLPNREQNADFLWAAITNKYFTGVLRPVPDPNQDYCDWVSDKTARFYNPDGDEKGNTGDETLGLNLEIAPATIAPAGQPGGTRTYQFQLYLGPKDRTLFQKDKLYRALGFIHTIDFMPCCCCPTTIIRPLAFGILAVMTWMYGFIGNYGVVIIILVFLVRLGLHPLTKKSQVSMSKMSKLAPKTEEIKKKYAKNKAEMNKQLMALYKEQGATPIMGMLPMFVQMPIWIALYSAIYASIELRGAAFLPFWITDLSAPDALVRFGAVTLPLFGTLNSLNLLPILMGVAFYLQQKLMPSQAAASTNPQVAQQQKMMMVMLPILFPLMLYKAPSGLNLYIMSSVFAGVIEQYVIRRHIQQREQQEAQGLVAATSKTGGKVKKKKPKPFYRF
jgi:YidC/Oxa1 family membrane protein insertase